MLRVEIKDAAVTEKPYEFDGRKGVSRSQVGWLHTGKAFPIEVKVKLSDRAPYPVGLYITGPRCFQFGERGRLEIRLIELLPLASGNSAKAA